MLFNTQDDVKKALAEGNKIYWENKLYYVKLDTDNRLLVICKQNDYTTALHDADLNALFIFNK